MSNTRLVYNRDVNAESYDRLFTSPLAGGVAYYGGPTIQAAQPVTRLATAKDRASASSSVVDPVISFSSHLVSSQSKTCLLFVIL